MLQDYLLIMKQELLLAVIIFLLLAVKLGRDRSNENLLHLVNVLLVVNLAAGFFGNKEGVLFNEMFQTNSLAVLEKNMLNLGTLIISLQSWNWLKGHRHLIEFYVLLLCTLLGMYFMIS